jgi:hypothetical protein
MTRTRVLAAALTAATAATVAYLALPPDGIFANGFDPAAPVLYCGQSRMLTAVTVGGQYSADMAQYENLLGKPSAQTRPVPFPSISTSPYLTSFGKQATIAARFVVPTDLAANMSGTIRVGETFAAGPRTVTMSLSTACGAFTAPSPCTVTRVGMGQGIGWKPRGGTTTGQLCELAPGATYFLNLKFDPVPPSSDLFNCTATACKLPLVSNVQGSRP